LRCHHKCKVESAEIDFTSQWYDAPILDWGYIVVPNEMLKYVESRRVSPWQSYTSSKIKITDNATEVILWP
jgi:hypothetical protein